MFITGPSIIESPLVPPAPGAAVPSQWERHSLRPPSPLERSNKRAQTLTPVVHSSLYSKLLSKNRKGGGGAVDLRVSFAWFPGLVLEKKDRLSVQNSISLALPAMA